MKDRKTVARAIIGAAFVGIGVLHFANPEPFFAIMPAWVPFHEFAVYFSGLAEISGGVGLQIPKLRRTAAWGLLALLFAVFPANINMAINEIQLPGSEPLPVWALWARLPMQFVMMWLVYWAGLAQGKAEATN